MALRVILLILLVGFYISAQSETLRQQYAKSPQKWPMAQASDGIMPSPLMPLTLVGAAPKANMVALGEQLFNDPILSKDNTKSCASCHAKDKLFADGLAQAIGVRNQVGTRNTPSIFGIDHWQNFFWEGRAASAAEQALMPIENPIEMDLPIAQVIERLQAKPEYQQQFKVVFSQSNGITPDNLAQALVAFERTIPAPQTLYQAFIEEVYINADEAVSMLSDSQLRGLHVFRTKAQCMTCHEGALLSDNDFHNTGLHNYGRRFEDLGRFSVSGDPQDIGKFRTPSLLGVTQTGPWMHNGLFIQFGPMLAIYNQGGFRPKPRREQRDDANFPHTTDLLQPLNLADSEMKDLIEFLHIL